MVCVPKTPRYAVNSVRGSTDRRYDSGRYRCTPRAPLENLTRVLVTEARFRPAMVVVLNQFEYFALLSMHQKEGSHAQE
eukprot:IDg7632t1